MKVEDMSILCDRGREILLKLLFAQLYVSYFSTGTLPLESIVDQAWLKLQQVLCIGEKVVLKIKAAGKV